MGGVKAVEMTVASGGRLLVFAPFTGLPGEVIEVTYLALADLPTHVYLVNPRSSGALAKEGWYAVLGLAPADLLLGAMTDIFDIQDDESRADRQFA